MSTISLLPAKKSWDLYEGDDFAPPVIEVYEGEELKDLTGYTYQMVIVNKRTRAAVATLTSEITNPATGQIQITVTDTAMASWPVGCPLEYDLRWITDSGLRRTILKGDLLIQPKV